MKRPLSETGLSVEKNQSFEPVKCLRPEPGLLKPCLSTRQLSEKSCSTDKTNMISYPVGVQGFNPVILPSNYQGIPVDMNLQPLSFINAPGLSLLASAQNIYMQHTELKKKTDTQINAEHALAAQELASLPYINFPMHMQYLTPMKFSRLKSIDTQKEVSEDEKIVTTGHWSNREECILLTLVRSMVNHELKIIAQAAWECKVHRNSRAVDKKLKRLINYKTWKDRNHESVLTTVDSCLKQSSYKLSKAETEMINRVIAKYAGRR